MKNDKKCPAMATRAAKNCHRAVVLQECISRAAFTLPELIIAVGVFATVAVMVSTMYVQAFHESKRANTQAQIFSDARFILERIAAEVRNGMVDYDEYYNQKVIIPSLEAGRPVPGAGPKDCDAGLECAKNFGQNYGRYYSSFFHPGTDEALGFDCNTVRASDGEVDVDARKAKRNQRTCTPLRKTIDRHTGANPFAGKDVVSDSADEDAFCGSVSYQTVDNILAPVSSLGECLGSGLGSDPAKTREEDELYLISGDGRLKTFFAREAIGEILPAGGGAAEKVYALSMLRMAGDDSDGDGKIDRFVCAPEFDCRSGADILDFGSDNTDFSCYNIGSRPEYPGDFPRSREEELEDAADVICDTAEAGFSKDFVPVSPLRVNVKKLNFIVSPTENPYYAFSETEKAMQPRVTIVLTIGPNPLTTGVAEKFDDITLVETVSAGVRAPIPAPLLVR